MVLFIVEQMILLYLTPPPTHQPSGVIVCLFSFLHTCQCFSSDVCLTHLFAFEIPPEGWKLLIPTAGSAAPCVNNQTVVDMTEQKYVDPFVLQVICRLKCGKKEREASK